jgi:diaminopimelate decarboxylase
MRAEAISTPFASTGERITIRIEAQGRTIKSFKKAPTQICSVFGPARDALDTLSMTEELPDLEIGELVYAENIGAYAGAGNTYFNGFPPARVVHVNQDAAVTV